MSTLDTVKRLINEGRELKFKGKDGTLEFTPTVSSVTVTFRDKSNNIQGFQMVKGKELNQLKELIDNLV